MGLPASDRREDDRPGNDRLGADRPGSGPPEIDLVTFTRQLVDIESITGNEAQVGNFLFRELSGMGYQVEKMTAEMERCNIYATPPGQPQPEVIFSTHMDTVPPFIPSWEDATCIYGRGSCDAKGIIASQIAAAQRLRAEGVYVGLLFLVGEERDSIGAKVANEKAPGNRFLINGEPTDNKIAVASKGALRAELNARGKMAHSAYPELGDSAIDKLVEALARLRRMDLPVDAEVGPGTMNIGVIEGRTRAQRGRRQSASAAALSPGWPVRETARTNSRNRGRFSQSRFHFGNTFRPPAHGRRAAHHGRRLHHRHPRAQQLGRAAVAGTRLHPHRPHRSRVRREKAVAGSGRVVLRGGQAAAGRIAARPWQAHSCKLSFRASLIGEESAFCLS